MEDGRLPVGVAVVALLAAGVAAFVIGTPAPSLRGDAAAREFLRTWRQSRMATFVVQSNFTRTLPDGKRLEDTTTTVQRPPTDRLTIGLGTVGGRLGGKVYRCAAAPDGSSKCLTGQDAGDYTTDVDREIAGLEQYVRGDRPLYRVVDFAQAQGYCFRLDLAVDVPAPPYGRHALFCFDTTTLAPSLTVIERVEATDRTAATSIRSTVTADDLQVNTGTGSIVGIPGPTTTTAPTTLTTTTTTPGSAPPAASGAN
ncbi:MAG TPA: hypothetical protein VGZ52_02320 [Acidimicrobiales bacterium]|nr:hypothetical protein [Acidimicrobiales bacterium]